ncbi:MAG: hypothetical protein EXQ63_03325 [Ilumatobacteraceae bacterium]|nr:hypothetical protein [Ilumatobacteraceae bacterium]
MELNHQFTVPVSIDQAWKILTDVERIAPCLPGAELQEIEGETYRGVVKVKVGPIQAQFKGQASFVERNDDAYKIVLKGEGRDTGGKGNASALITAELTAESATTTGCVVNTDLAITGKVAQFGRGAMADISDKILAQFVQNLNELIASQPATASISAPAQTQDAGPRKIDGPTAAPINLLETAGSTIAKRAIPVLFIIVGIIIYFIAK